MQLWWVWAVHLKTQGFPYRNLEFRPRGEGGKVWNTRPQPTLEKSAGAEPPLLLTLDRLVAHSLTGVPSRLTVMISPAPMAICSRPLLPGGDAGMTKVSPGLPGWTGRQASQEGKRRTVGSPPSLGLQGGWRRAVREERGARPKPGSPASLFRRWASHTVSPAALEAEPGATGLKEAAPRFPAGRPLGALPRPEVASPPLPHAKAWRGSGGPARWAVEEGTEQLRGPSPRLRGGGGRAGGG